MARKFSMDRRAYLKTVGAAGTTATVAGCLGGNGDGNGNGNGSGNGNGDGDGTDVIVPGTASGFPPFEYTQDGELVGFDVDLTEEAITRAGYELGEWVDIEFDSLIPSLTGGDIDLIAAAMTITDERAEQIAFSNPYYEANQSVLVRSDGEFSPEGESDLEGRVVGAQSGTTGAGEAERLIEEGIVDGGDYRQYDNYTLAVQDLENGNVDAIIIDVPVASNFADSRSVEVAFVIETGEEYGLGMQQDDDRLSDVNDALAEIREDGTYDDLVSEYFE
jgi:polar amino acid transport system substrate-binding protein